MPPKVGIFSLKDDLHALAVQHRLQHRFGVDCVVVETDDLVVSGGLTWHVGGEDSEVALRARGGAWFDPRDLDLIWWRRSSYPQRGLPDGFDEDAAQLVTQEWRYALVGLLRTTFRGVWVDHPDRVRAAENKLDQLRAAELAGLRVPRTLVSQDPAAVRAFCTEVGDVVVKAVRGLAHRPQQTSAMDVAVVDDASIRLCPAIYQELVPGRRHLRICCFGERVLAVALDSEDLDWRWDLTRCTFEPVDLPAPTGSALATVLDRLGITMASMDAKVRPDGEVVWLEANPQGQFLFLEGLTGLDLTGPFCEFLLESARRGQAGSAQGSAVAVV
ncbi:hypothetical protein Cch01nite_14780 [Cellulomonas chitinilytica]|uniref:ATP-grasp domain-containing protein n=1 Tax=Cellulomonas chitinilytica TaxID=398759 RepID=A0A919U239_9CELL|nr:hypothetical protein [Cellulomonas chitinilytica]GIG20754.1 hypothetical protein Cch01nite_14780 [Cellulomonas chitinilytica]